MNNLQVGNFANDGFKLGNSEKSCTAQPDDGLEEEATGGTLRYGFYILFFFETTFNIFSGIKTQRTTLKSHKIVYFSVILFSRLHTRRRHSSVLNIIFHAFPLHKLHGIICLNMYIIIYFSFFHKSVSRKLQRNANTQTMNNMMMLLCIIFTAFS